MTGKVQYNQVACYKNEKPWNFLLSVARLKMRTLSSVQAQAWPNKTKQSHFPNGSRPKRPAATASGIQSQEKKLNQTFHIKNWLMREIAKIKVEF